MLAFVAAIGGLESQRLYPLMAIGKAQNALATSATPSLDDSRLTIVAVGVLLVCGVLLHLVVMTVKHVRGVILNVFLLAMHLAVWGLARSWGLALVVIMYATCGAWWWWCVQPKSCRPPLRIFVTYALATALAAALVVKLPFARFTLDATIATLLWLWTVSLGVALLCALRGSGRVRWGDLRPRKSETPTAGVKGNVEPAPWFTGTQYLSTEKQYLENLQLSVIRRSAKYRATLLLMFVNIGVIALAGALLAWSADRRETTSQTEEAAATDTSVAVQPGAFVERVWFSAGQTCGDTQGVTIDRLATRPDVQNARRLRIVASVDGLAFRRNSPSPFATNVGLVNERLRCVADLIASRLPHVDVLRETRDASSRAEAPNERVVDVYRLQ